MPLGIRLASGRRFRQGQRRRPAPARCTAPLVRRRYWEFSAGTSLSQEGWTREGTMWGTHSGSSVRRVRGRRSVVSRRRATVASLWATIAEESLDATVGVLGGSGSAALGTRFVTQGYRFFTNPSATSLLKILGSDEEEQIRTLTDLLRNSSEEEINDLMNRLTQAISRLAEERQSSSLRRPRPRSVSPSVQRRRARRQRGA